MFARSIVNSIGDRQMVDLRAKARQEKKEQIPSTETCAWKSSPSVPCTFVNCFLYMSIVDRSKESQNQLAWFQGNQEDSKQIFIMNDFNGYQKYSSFKTGFPS